MRLPRYCWLPLAALCLAVGGWVRVWHFESFPAGWARTDDAWWSTLPALGHPKLLFLQLGFSGYYPLFPTFAFFLVGMWIAHLDLRSRGVLLWLAGIGGVLTIAGNAVGWNTDDRRASVAADHESAWRLLSAAGHSHMPVWMFAATGTALVVVAVSELIGRVPLIGRVLAHAGQLALTFYVLHVGLLRRGLREWPWGWSDGRVLTALFAGFAAFAGAAHLWRRYLRYGPAEALLRLPDQLTLSGRSH